MKVKAANYKHKKTENIIEQTNQTVASEILNQNRRYHSRGVYIRHYVIITSKY